MIIKVKTNNSINIRVDALDKNIILGVSAGYIKHKEYRFDIERYIGHADKLKEVKQHHFGSNISDYEFMEGVDKNATALTKYMNEKVLKMFAKAGATEVIITAGIRYPGSKSYATKSNHCVGLAVDFLPILTIKQWNTFIKNNDIAPGRYVADIYKDTVNSEGTTWRAHEYIIYWNETVANILMRDSATNAMLYIEGMGQQVQPTEVTNRWVEGMKSLVTSGVLTSSTQSIMGFNHFAVKSTDKGGKKTMWQERFKMGKSGGIISSGDFILRSGIGSSILNNLIKKR